MQKSGNQAGRAQEQRDENRDGPGQEQQDKTLFAEKDRIDRLGRIRELVFGSLDGLLVPLGVVSGVAGGTGSSQAVIVAGLAEAFAGALSMGAGEFVSGRAEAQVHQTEIDKELAEIREEPDREQEEMVALLEHEGIAEDDATRIVALLTRYPDSYHKTVVEKELGLQMDTDLIRIREALTMGASYIVGSLFPLIAYFIFPIGTALPISIGLTIVALIVVGIIKGKLATLNLWRSTIEVVVIGGASALGGYLLGTYVPHLFGY
jgi:VIT1/CCC1 family predicted Fe2+/Mn2+ transporter